MFGRRFVIAEEALRFHRLIRREITSPAETDWLVPEFHFHAERPYRVAGLDPITGKRSFIVEVGIVGGLAHNGDVGFGGFLIEPLGRMRLSFRYPIADKSPVVTFPCASSRIGTKICTCSGLVISR